MVQRTIDPDNPDSSIGFLIADVSRLMRRVYDSRIEHLGLTRSQWRVMVHLYRRNELSQTELAHVLEIEKPTLGRLVEKLEANGWVVRRVDERDSRARLVALTKAAHGIIDEMEALAEEVHRDALAGIPKSQASQLSENLLTVKQNLLSLVTEGNGRNGGGAR